MQTSYFNFFCSFFLPFNNKKTESPNGNPAIIQTRGFPSLLLNRFGFILFKSFQVHAIFMQILKIRIENIYFNYIYLLYRSFGYDENKIGIKIRKLFA